eukprot:4612894-Amphidinium_carterae.1
MDNEHEDEEEEEAEAGVEGKEALESVVHALPVFLCREQNATNDPYKNRRMHQPVVGHAGSQCRLS